MNTIKVEFHFYAETEVAVVIDKSALYDKEFEKTGEILLFNSVLLRNLHNVAYDQPKTQKVARVFASLNENNIVEYVQVIGAVPYRGEGKQRFTGTLKFGVQKGIMTGNMTWKYKGFPFFKRTTGKLETYGLRTPVYLMTVLGMNRIDDEEYMTWLGKSAYWCGALYLSGKVGLGKEMSYIDAAVNIMRSVGAWPGYDANV